MRTARRRGKAPANARVFGGGGPSGPVWLSSRACRGISAGDWAAMAGAKGRDVSTALDMTEELGNGVPRAVAGK